MTRPCVAESSLALRTEAQTKPKTAFFRVVYRKYLLLFHPNRSAIMIRPCGAQLNLALQTEPLTQPETAFCQSNFSELFPTLGPQPQCYYDLALWHRIEPCVADRGADTN